MNVQHKFNTAEFLIPSFVYIIGVGGAVVILQLVMVYLKTGRAVMSSGVDTPTIVYTLLTAAILIMSVVLPLIAVMRRKSLPLISISSEEICIREKALKKARCFMKSELSSIKLYVSEAEKRSSMRLELITGQVILLQLFYVLIDQGKFKIFMNKHCNFEVLDWE